MRALIFVLVALGSCACEQSAIEWSNDWSILGPIPSAPRENVDYSSAFGSLDALRQKNQSLPSELGEFGLASWSQFKPSKDGSVSVPFLDPSRWDFLGKSLGSAVMQVQAWATTNFTVSGAPLLFSCTGKQFYIDGVRYHGDTYGMGAFKVPLSLAPGEHTLSLWALGAAGISFQCQGQEMPAQKVVLLGESEDIFPDAINGYAASSFVGVSAMNTHKSEWIRDVEAILLNEERNVQAQTLTLHKSIAPGQTGQIQLKLSSREFGNKARSFAPSYNLTLIVSGKIGKRYVESSRRVQFRNLEYHEPFVFTFLDVDESVQYAAAIAPTHECACQKDGCPIILSTHGAGVEAKSGAWTGSYQKQRSSWVLLPTNRQNFGFDWQGLGMRNAIRSLEALSSKDVQAFASDENDKYRPDPTRIVFAGHSMGGHGCLVLSSRYPDLALAAVPASGWIKHQLYTPYLLRISDSWSDPWLKATLESAIAEYDTDMYSQNLKGIPFLVRMGSIDDNVSPWHLRRFARLLDEVNGKPGFTKISEIPNQGHWFDGIVDDAVIQSFFDEHISNTSCSIRPPLPQEFTVSCVNPATFQSRGGIRLLQLLSPYKKALVRVSRLENNVWSLRTTNVQRIGFSFLEDMIRPASLVVDGISINFSGDISKVQICRTGKNVWSACDDADVYERLQRSPATYGPARQAFEGPLTIVIGSRDSSAVSELLQLALFMANDFYVQGRLSPQIITDDEAMERVKDSKLPTNVIVLGGEDVNSFTEYLASEWEKNLGPDSLARTHSSSISLGKAAKFSGDSFGIQFLAPFFAGQSGRPRLALVIAGTDIKGLRVASQIFAGINGFKSGMEVPDFLITTKDFLEGSAGLAAAGFWSNSWEFTESSGYIDSSRSLL